MRNLITPKDTKIEMTPRKMTEIRKGKIQDSIRKIKTQDSMRKVKIQDLIRKGISEKKLITIPNTKPIEIIPETDRGINNTEKTKTHNTNQNTHITLLNGHNLMINILLIQTRNNFQTHRIKIITNTTLKTNHR